MTHLRSEDYCIKDVAQAEALDMVRRWHYARGGSNTATHRHGLFAKDDPSKPLGVAWWLPPTKVAALSVSANWTRVVALTRLVVAQGLPTNAASFLLGRSIRIIRKEGVWKTLLTYADEGEGHTGQIYKATNWEYLGKVPGSTNWLDPVTGRTVASKISPKTRTVAEMEELGYVRKPKAPKHKYVLHL